MEMQSDNYAKVEAPTFVYVMCWADKVKIGITREPEKRLRQLQLANPGEVRLLHHRQFSTRLSAVKVERQIHKRFKAKRLLGEWFDMSPGRAIKAVDAVPDPELHHEHWHPLLPFAVGAQGALERWKWFRVHNLPMVKGIWG